MHTKEKEIARRKYNDELKRQASQMSANGQAACCDLAKHTICATGVGN